MRWARLRKRTKPNQGDLEVRALSAKVAADMAAPIKSHVSRSIEKLRDELSPRDL
jgi:hypothetical protein